MGMRPNCHNGQLCIPGDHSRQGGAPNSHGRDAKVSKNEDIIQHQIDQHSANSGEHGNHRLTVFTQCTGIRIGKCKRQQTKQHDLQIVHPIAQKQLGILVLSLAFEIQPDQRFPRRQENSHTQHRQQQTD